MEQQSWPVVVSALSSRSRRTREDGSGTNHVAPTGAWSSEQLAISKIPEEDQHASGMYEAEEVLGVIFEPGDESSVVLKPGEEAFHLPATRGTSCGEALVIPTATGRSALFEIALALGREEDASVSRLDTSVKLAVRSLVGRVAIGQVRPLDAGSENPQNAVHHVSWIPPRSSSTVRTRRRLRIQRFDERPLLVGDIQARSPSRGWVSKSEGESDCRWRVAPV